jgi:hypothetical protein
MVRTPWRFINLRKRAQVEAHSPFVSCSFILVSSVGSFKTLGVEATYDCDVFRREEGFLGVQSDTSVSIDGKTGRRESCVVEIGQQAGRWAPECIVWTIEIVPGLEVGFLIRLDVLLVPE